MALRAASLALPHFGVFESQWSAEWLKNGYIQDLQQEGTEIIDVQIQQCQPKQLTIEEHEIEANQELSQNIMIEKSINLDHLNSTTKWLK